VARIRTIKPEFFTSEDIVNLSPLTRLLYIAIWCEADKEGRLTWKPMTFKLRYFPGDNCDTKAMCQKLVDAGLIVLYGNGLAYCPTFSKHQHINPRESASQLPDPSASSRVTNASARVNSGIDPQVGREGKGREGNDKEGKVNTALVAPFVLPDWINREHWNAWHSSPKRKKATVEQKDMAVAKLSEWRCTGQDFAGALENAALGGYQGLFLPDKSKPGALKETAYQQSKRELWEVATGRNKQTGVIYDDAKLLG